MADRPRIVGITMLAAATVLAAASVVPSSARQENAPVAGLVPANGLDMVAQVPPERGPDRGMGLPRNRLDPPAHSVRASSGLSAELIEQCMDVARDVDPALSERLEVIRRERSPAEFARAIHNARHLRGLAGLKDEDPQLYDVKVKELRLDAQADRLLKQLSEARRTASAVTDDLEAQLHGLVQQQVAVSLVARGMYLRRLTEHVKALREELEHDLGHFQNAVDRRMKRVLQELDEGSPNGTPEG
jgi:hypothetical protein